MLLRIVRFLAVIIVALGLVPGGAHALEMAPKMGYSADLYTAVTSTLYLYYGIVGAIVQVGSVLIVAMLAWLVRRRCGFGWTVAAALILLGSLIVWGALVAPVNATWGHVLHANPDVAPAAYARLRPRWEYGHLVAFGAWLIGFICLVISILLEVPESGTSRIAQG
jgi:hypothetical protein